MAASSGDVTHVATVYFCPEGERVRANTPSTNFRLAPDTTFFEILQGACMYYEQNISDSVLRNASGSIWPVKDLVAHSLRGGEIRLTPNDRGDEGEEKKEEVVEEEIEKDEVDDGRVVAARPPLIRELVLHMLFLTVLVADTYMVGTYPAYKTHNALENAFILPRNSMQPLIEDHAIEYADNFRSVHTPRQMCTWLTNRLIDGLFQTDLHDAWGDIEVYNRVAVRAAMRNALTGSPSHTRPCTALSCLCSRWPFAGDSPSLPRGFLVVCVTRRTRTLPSRARVLTGAQLGQCASLYRVA